MVEKAKDNDLRLGIGSAGSRQPRAPETKSFGVRQPSLATGKPTPGSGPGPRQPVKPAKPAAPPPPKR